MQIHYNHKSVVLVTFEQTLTTICIIGIQTWVKYVTLLG